MKLLSNYDKYINELKIEEALRTFPLFLSKRLRTMLRDIDHDIARELLSKHSDLGTRVKQTFVDIHPEKEDFITFINPNKAAEVLGWDLTDDTQLDDLEQNFDVAKLNRLQDRNALYKNFRGETRWGRFINASFPEQYKQSLPGGQNKEDIESFVNLYKALYSRAGKFEMLDIVNGDRIAYWYNCRHYAGDRGGTLGESCMKRQTADTFQIYTDNPDKCSMIIMYSDSTKRKIKARALLWTLNVPEGRKFMDRVYTEGYADEQIYIDYAKENGYLYKSSQSMGSSVHTTDPTTNRTSALSMMAELHHTDYDRYPYCDSMAYFNPDTGEITNKGQDFNAKYELNCTGGGRYETSYYEQTPVFVHSKYHGEEINQHTAKYCKLGDDWVRAGEAIRVHNSGIEGEVYSVPNNPDVVNSRFMRKNRDGEEREFNRNYPKRKCVWSEHLNTWVFRGDTTGAVNVWANLERTESVVEHLKRLNFSFKEVDGEYWLKTLVRNGRLIGETSAPVQRPVGEAPAGWHRRSRFVDEDGNIWTRGKFTGREVS